MVYHEVRIREGKKYNYLVFNSRKNGKWKKNSKFIGPGDIQGKKISGLKKEFETEILVNKKYVYLDKQKLIVLENLRKSYFDGLKHLSKEEFDKFEKSFFTELTYNSNAIEGNSLSLEQTGLVLNDNIAPEGKKIREIYEAKNHAKALRYIKSYKGRLDERFILKLHSIILDGISENFAGRYREANVRIFGSDVKFPQSYLVPQLMKNLIYWYEKSRAKYHPFELAVLFSVKFVTIHPFVDGNGRMSRLLMNYALMKKWYPWINVYMKRREEYLKAVRKANDEEYLPIIDFLLATLEGNLKDFGFIDKNQNSYK